MLRFILGLILFAANGAYAGADHDHHEHESGHTTIAPAIAEQTGITVARAGPGVIRQTRTLYGRTTIAPDRLSHIYARFPGIVKTVKVNIGDPVQAGAVLAEVESNESLKLYSLTAPIEGVITQRHANAGEATRDQLLFAIAGFDPLMAELQVFPGQLSSIRSGQSVQLSAADLSQQSQVLHLLPGEGDVSTMTARALIANPDNLWSPGLLVMAEVNIETSEVYLRVDNRALQTYEGGNVVFVQEGENYTARPIQTGRRDATHTEVLEGLHPGEIYVVTQSYLIKADLEKAGAEHHH